MKNIQEGDYLALQDRITGMMGREKTRRQMTLILMTMVFS